MKIIYIYDAIARIGGTEKILVDKMNYLANEYNQDVYLLTTCQGNHPIVFPLSPKVTNIDLAIRSHTKYQYSFLKRFFKGLAMSQKLKEKLRKTIDEINPDIIIATSYYAADIICNLDCKAHKIIESHVAKIHTGTNDGVKHNFIIQIFKKWESYKYFRTIEKKADIIVTLTKGDAENWHTDKTVVIPNIVQINDTASYSTLENKTAIFTGRFTYQKGLERMLEAWKIVASKRKDWTLKLVGEGEQKEQLIKLCNELGIENNVIFIEATQDISKEYLNSSIFLLSSRHEGLPLVLIEAMQFGVPCISFDCPYGPADIINDGENGYLIENGIVEKFAQAIIKLIDNNELRMKMGKAAIEKSKRYLPNQIMPRWIKLFNKLSRK